MISMYSGQASASTPILRLVRAILQGERLPRDADPDWARVTWLLHHHGLASRASRILREAAADCPASAKESLLQGHLRAQKMHALAEALLPGWIDGLRARGMPVALLKGWGAARRFYEIPEDRDFCDFDLLLAESRRDEALRFFQGLGFEEREGTARWKANQNKVELVWSRNSEVSVECHFGLGYGAFALDGYWDRIDRSVIPLAGGAWELPHLGIEDEFLYLVYHAGVQHRFQKLLWLVDLAQLAARYPELLHAQGELPRRAARHGLVPALGLVRALIQAITAADGAHAFDGPAGLILSRIILGHYEASALAKAGLRARLQGGWLPLAGYGIRRALAQARHR